MATLYVRSTNASSGNGSTWALAKKTLAEAFTAAAAGDTIYVSHAHAETQVAAMTLTSPGTSASPCKVICVNDGAEPPTTLATTATITVTGTYSLTFEGSAVYYGITFTSSEGNTPTTILIAQTSAANIVFKECVLKTLSSNGLASIKLGAGGAYTRGYASRVYLENTSIYLNNASQRILSNSPIYWYGGSLLGTAPTGGLLQSEALTTASGPMMCVEMVGVDLSLVGSNPLVLQSTDTRGYVRLRNCKVGSGAFSSGDPAYAGGIVLEVDNCDNADTNYRMYHKDYFGVVQQETTKVLSGGASNGTTSISWLMASSANSKFATPLKSPPIYLWNDTASSSKTLTVEALTDGVTLTDAEAWLEVEYLGNGSYPISSVASDSCSTTIGLGVSGSASNQETSTATWTTTGLSSPVKQKFAVTITPQEKGPIACRVCLAKASTTMYVDPKVTVS